MKKIVIFIIIIGVVAVVVFFLLKKKNAVSEDVELDEAGSPIINAVAGVANAVQAIKNNSKEQKDNGEFVQEKKSNLIETGNSGDYQKMKDGNGETFYVLTDEAKKRLGFTVSRRR